MKLIFATNNKHKIREISDLLDDRFEIIGLADVSITEDIPCLLYTSDAADE